MTAFLTLTRREMGSYLVTWTGYVVIAAVLFVLGLGLLGLIQALNLEPASFSITELFYDTFVFWLVLVVATPVITMRLFAQEKQSGTFETLMTAPVSDLVVVLAKFFAALLFYCLMWLPMLGMLFALRRLTQASESLDPGALATTCLGVFLLGMLYIAMGCWASSLTRSQVIAAMGAFVLGLSLFLAGYLAYAVPPQVGWPHLALNQMNIHQHMKDFARGVLDTRAVVFLLGGTFLFLFLTLKSVESRRWK